MKTRNQIYNGESSDLLNLICTYHALKYDQVAKYFSRSRQSMKSFVTSLIKQKRIYKNTAFDLLCDTPESAEYPDYSMIMAFWVLLDFKDSIIYHISGEFPVKLHFFSKDQAYEVIYVHKGQEALMNAVFRNNAESDSNRIIVLESVKQIDNLFIENVIAFCLIDDNGKVNYYQKK